MFLPNLEYGILLSIKFDPGGNFTTFLEISLLSSEVAIEIDVSSGRNVVVMMSNESSGFEFSSLVSYFMLDSIPGLILPPGSSILLNFSISSLLNFAFSSSLGNGSAIVEDIRNMVKITPRVINDV